MARDTYEQYLENSNKDDAILVQLADRTVDPTGQGTDLPEAQIAFGSSSPLRYLKAYLQSTGQSGDATGFARTLGYGSEKELYDAYQSKMANSDYSELEYNAITYLQKQGVQAPFEASQFYKAPPSQVPTSGQRATTQPTTQTQTQTQPAIQPPTVALQPGSTNTAEVKKLQDFLVSAGYMTREQVNTGYGTYGPQTTAAVKKYQEALGIDNSTGPGYWGPRTIEGYNKSTSSSLSPTAPAVGSINDPITSPSSGGSTGSLNLSVPSGGIASATYTTSLTKEIETLRKQVLAEADKRSAEYQTKISALEKKEAELEALQKEGMADIGDATFREIAEKRAAYDLEKQRFDENYNANQALVGELETLLTQGNTIIQQMQETTGLSSIMQPRIAKTMSDVAARAGVIEAVMNARNGQMANAQNQLATSLNAISSIYNDEINYYKDVINFYGGLKAETRDKITGYEKDQKEYADVKINMLASQLQQLEATKANIEQALLDPDTALAYGMAGVTLNDSVEQINRKLAQYQYTQEVKDNYNTMTTNGYTTKKIAGVEPVAIYDSQGKATNWYKAPGAGEDFTLGTNQVRFDSAGNVIARGPASKDDSGGGSSSNVTKLTPTDKQGLLAVGFTSTDIPTIEKGVNQYGLQEVVDSNPQWTKAQKDAVTKAYGGTQKISRNEVVAAIDKELITDKDYIKDGLTAAYTDEELQTFASEAGLRHWYTSWASEKEKYLASDAAKKKYTDLLYSQYQAAGLAE